MAQEIIIIPTVCDTIIVSLQDNGNHVNIKQGSDWIECDREYIPALIAALTEISKQQ